MSVIQSSRFWLCLVCIVGAFFLVGMGKLGADVAIAFVSGVVGGFGVAKSGSSKATGLTALVAIIGLNAACSSLPRQLDALRESNKQLTLVALDYYHGACTDAAAECGGTKDCPRYRECDIARERTVKTSKAVNSAIVIAATAIALGREDTAKIKVIEAITLIQRIQKIIEEFK